MTSDNARERIALGAGAAVLVAGLVLVAIVLPAEYAVDPLGTGRRLGLLPLGEVGRQIDTLAAADRGSGGAVVVAQPRKFQQETIEFSIAAGGSMEYKYRLAKGNALLFAWHAGAPVNVEFHAEPDGAPRGYAETYEKKTGASEASGTLTAPFDGIHGWYWENTGTAPVVVTLSSAGFYNLAYEFQKDQPPRTRVFE